MKPLPNVTIESLGALGKGVATLDGRKVFVLGGLPGDIVKIKITKKKRRYFEAKWVDLIEKSTLRTQTLCPHFPVCGGCQFVDISYDTQLELKHNSFKASQESLFPDLDTTILPSIGSVQTEFYRNKMEYAFGKSEDGEIYLGQKVRGTFDQVVPLTSCYLQSEESRTIMATACALLNTFKLSVWDHETHEGILRYLTVRHSKTEDKYMLILVVSESVADIMPAFIKALTENHPSISSIFMSIQATASDTAASGVLSHWFGEEKLVETLDHLTFHISPSSFFQTNTKQAAVLYQTIRKTANLQKDETVMDLYCGTGTIGLYCAPDAKEVIGIEEHAAAIDNANANAELNAVKNATFKVGRVKNILKFEDFSPDVVIVDPPRCGMVPKALQRMIDLDAPRVVYVSCNPASLFRDLQVMCEQGYRVKTLQPVDMFPHTYHLECVADLEKIR